MAGQKTQPATYEDPKDSAPAASERRIRARNMVKILKAATEVFSRKGFDGTRMVEIAALSGLPKANVYYYFSTKEEIYKAAIDRLINSWDRAFQYISVDREPAQALDAYIKAKLDHARRNVAETRLFASEILQGSIHLSEEARTHIAEVTNQRAKVIESWIAAGKIVPVDPKHLFFMIWSATQFYAESESLACDILQTGQLKEKDYRLAARTISQTILTGILLGNQATAR